MRDIEIDSQRRKIECLLENNEDLNIELRKERSDHIIQRTLYQNQNTEFQQQRDQLKKENVLLIQTLNRSKSDHLLQIKLNQKQQIKLQQQSNQILELQNEVNELKKKQQSVTTTSHNVTLTADNNSTITSQNDEEKSSGSQVNIKPTKCNESGTENLNSKNNQDQELQLSKDQRETKDNQNYCSALKEVEFKQEIQEFQYEEEIQPSKEHSQYNSEMNNETNFMESQENLVADDTMLAIIGENENLLTSEKRSINKEDVSLIEEFNEHISELKEGNKLRKSTGKQNILSSLANYNINTKMVEDRSKQAGIPKIQVKTKEEENIKSTLANYNIYTKMVEDRSKQARIPKIQIKTKECKICCKSFSRRYTLKVHIDTVHKKKNHFKCTICSKTFTQKGTLKIHDETVHKKRKPFKCINCPKSFGQLGHLNNHQDRVHP
jgi:hypothetical protein